VSGDPDFFKRAFGNTVGEFETLLWRPHHYIFHRDAYEKGEGRAEFDEYNVVMKKLSPSDHAELRLLLHDVDPREILPGAHPRKYYFDQHRLSMRRRNSGPEQQAYARQLTSA
jgi:hypothetical protein